MTYTDYNSVVSPIHVTVEDYDGEVSLMISLWVSRKNTDSQGVDVLLLLFHEESSQYFQYKFCDYILTMVPTRTCIQTHILSFWQSFSFHLKLFNTQFLLPFTCYDLKSTVLFCQEYTGTSSASETYSKVSNLLSFTEGP